MTRVSLNSLLILIVLSALAITFLIIIPAATTSLLDINSKYKESIHELREVPEKFSPESINKKKVYTFFGIEFDDPARLIDIFSKLMGTLFTFLGISWSIYTWKQGRKLKIEKNSSS